MQQGSYQLMQHSLREGLPAHQGMLNLGMLGFPQNPCCTWLKSSACTDRRKTTKRQAPPRTPEPVEGRKHIDIQTDAYLEELTDTIPEVDNTTQTDAFLDRPPTPLFIPQKTGVDATTQIENGRCWLQGKEASNIMHALANAAELHGQCHAWPCH